MSPADEAMHKQPFMMQAGISNQAFAKMLSVGKRVIFLFFIILFPLSSVYATINIDVSVKSSTDTKIIFQITNKEPANISSGEDVSLVWLKKITATLASNNTKVYEENFDTPFKGGQSYAHGIDKLKKDTKYNFEFKFEQRGNTKTILLSGTTKTATLTTPPPRTNNTNTNNQTTSTVFSSQTNTATAPATGMEPKTQCNDGKDNQIGDGQDYGLGISMGDGKADYGGVDVDKDGAIDLEPDPACFYSDAGIENADDVAKGSLIPCTDKCSFTDVIKLLNNLITFAIKNLLIPLFVIIIMYAGYSYITSQGNSSKRVNLKNLLKHLLMGILLILLAWVIVHTILTTLGVQEGLLFFE